jgi:alkylhydroperoxidase family enzyme
MAAWRESGMAFIRTIPESEAVGDVAEVYSALADARGRVANILKVESLAPPALRAHYALYRQLMFARGPLARPERELIAVVVSHANDCEY